MEETRTSPGAATAAPRRRLIAIVVAVALVAVSVPLALAGGELVAGNLPGPDPRWVFGVFGEGFVDRPMVYPCLLWLAIGLRIALLMLSRDLGVRWTAAVAALLIVLFVLAPPLLSLDVFSYVSYARLGAEHGLNPYTHSPADLLPGDDAAIRVIDYRGAVSVYGPVFTLASYPLGLVAVPVALWSLKVIAGISIAALAAIVARLAALRGVAPATAVAFVALNPIVLVHLVGGAHTDGLMAAIAMAAVAAALIARPATAGAGFVVAAAVKVSALLYAPFALVGARGLRTRGRMIAGGLAALVAIGAVSLVVFGADVGEALSVAGGNQGRVSRWSVPATLARASGLDVDLLRAVLGVGLALALAWLIVAVARGFDWVRAAGWAALAVLVASAYIVPWYLIWLLPLAAVSRDRALIGATIVITIFQAINGVPVTL
jgi:alpha-1,6-mannosyltransferase